MLKSLKNEQREKKFAKHERRRHKKSGINFSGIAKIREAERKYWQTEVD